MANMAKNDHSLAFPDIHKYAQSENLTEDVLIKAFKLENHYRSLLIHEKDSIKRYALYDEFYAKLIPIYGRDSDLDDESNPKDKYLKLFTQELTGASVIDFGCGQGEMLKSIQNRLGNKRLTGVDVFIPDTLKAHTHIQFIESNIINYSNDDLYDVAFSDNVIEHLVEEDARTHLKNILHSLRPGGKLIIIMPNRLFGPWDITRIKDFSQSGKTPAQGGHVNESTHFEMSGLLKQIGFKQVKTIVPIPKLKYSLFSSLRIQTRWVESIEKSDLLLGFFRRLRINGACVFKFPVTLIAEK